MERPVGFEPTMQELQSCALPNLAMDAYKLILSLSANYLVPQQATSGKFFVLTNKPFLPNSNKKHDLHRLNYLT